MTRPELELLCLPLTPEEVLDGLQHLYDLHNDTLLSPEEDLETLKAIINIFKRLIEAFDESPSVRVRRSIW